jgi:putative MATE family efflux protein
MDLVNEPIPKLIRQIAVPASVGFFFNTMYNIVDTLFAGLHSTDALAALAASFPIFFIIIALGAGIGQGTTALISNSIGEKDEAKGHHYTLQSVSFGFFFSILLTLGGLASAPYLFRFLGASDRYLELSLQYMNTILLGTVFFLLQSILNSSLNALGDTKTYRNVLIVGFVFNCALDPWFMYGGFGLPAMGVRGIALATVLIQFFGSVYMFWRVQHTRIWGGFSWSLAKPDVRMYRDIAAQGLPASLNMMTMALGIFVITWFIGKFSKEGVAAYGIATRVEQIFLLPTIGLNISILSLTGQNNGARRFDRIRESLNTTLKYGMIMTLSSGVLIYFSGGWFMSLFTDDAAVRAFGSDYLKVAAITLPSYVILFQTVFMLQGLKKPVYAIWVGLYRQILAPCAVFWLLAFHLDWKLRGIWWGIFLVTWSAALFMGWFGRWKLGKVEAAAWLKMQK